MRRLFLLLCAALFAVMSIPAFAGGGGNSEKKESDPETLRRSLFPGGSYPGGPVSKSPLATGYYVTDNDGPASGPPWQPNFAFTDTTINPEAWHRIASGPNQGVTETDFGLEYFRNPNDPDDSTDNALAGPISIGFPFYYYGRKYDSFYVSTNGLVALTNRRYQYDADGERTGYDPFSEDNRARSGNAATDPVPDDYGYQYVALNNSTSRTAGILNPNNVPFPVNSLRSTLAPLWDDQELSQLSPTSGLPQDYGRVYWRLDNLANKLIIYYSRISMKGDALKNIPVINQIQRVAAQQLNARFQVVLNRTDSSVQFNYIQFTGNYVDQAQGIFQIPSAAMYRANATIGIQSHDKEYTNYMFSRSAGEQGIGGAVYVNGDPGSTPHDNLAINFKQWKNVVRVLEVSFQRPDPDNPNVFESLDKKLRANNYELLLGHPVLGVIRPVGIVENVSSNVGPVNITQQPIRFNVIFRIRDLVNISSFPVYQKSETTKQLYPIAVAPGEANSDPNRPNIDTIIFDAYNPNPTVTKNVGRFKAEIIATDNGPNGIRYGEQWPFDDTTGVTIFGIRRVELPYVTTFNNYSSSEDGIVPDVTNWVSIGAQVVDGNVATYNPPPPRGQYGVRGLYSPVALLDRNDINGAFYNNDVPGELGGDTLISFPVNLSTALNQPIILLSYSRAGRQTYNRGWADAVLIGPEQAVYNTVKSGFYQIPDHLVVEFAEPSDDDNRINNITNARRWSEKDFLKNEGSIPADEYWGNVASPRWAVFGGGGGQDTSGTLILNEFDGGKDFLFNRAVVPIPERWTDDIDVSKYFRFRLRVIAQSHKNPLGPPADDNDPFYVDNIIVTDPDKPEVEVTAIQIDWPYTEAPASQARAIPMSVKVSNNGTTAATAFGVALTVENQTSPTPGFFSYYRYKTIISLGAGEDQIEEFPSWNAQECGEDIDADVDTTGKTTDYKVSAQILPAGYDSYNANDVTYTDFRLRLGTTFAYDRIDDNGRGITVTNDVSQISGTSGKGLNLVAPYPDPNGAQPYGPLGGSISGTFAMQFRILSRDTIRGFQAWYGSANSAPDAVLYAVYKQPAGTSVNAAPQKLATNPNLGLINATRRFAQRGGGRQAYPNPNIPNPGPYYYDEYVVYELDQPYVADPGIYFATVSQLGQTGIELGASTYRMGQVITVYDPTGGGAGNFHIAGHPEMAQNRFWYETTFESGSWSPMLTTIGNPGYPHLNIAGQNPAGWPTWQRGSWVPMIRPYFGPKNSTSCEILPVELANFKATPLTSAIRLDWETATELNNAGFNVERRTEGQDRWNDVAFVEGAGTSNQANTYNFVDGDVQMDVTYQYRLRQQDFDGATNYSPVREARISAATGSVAVNALMQNTPNPASAETYIPFVVAQDGMVTIEISDVYGKVVRTLQLEASASGDNVAEWDLTNEQGERVANGTYIYKMIGDGFTQSRKMTVVR